MTIKARHDWVDSLKFLGIFAIYIGHLGAGAGKLYPFVFSYLINSCYSFRFRAFHSNSKSAICNMLYRRMPDYL